LAGIQILESPDVEPVYNATALKERSIGWQYDWSLRVLLI
jgi:hypothetical protein